MNFVTAALDKLDRINAAVVPTLRLPLTGLEPLDTLAPGDDLSHFVGQREVVGSKPAKGLNIAIAFRGSPRCYGFLKLRIDHHPAGVHSWGGAGLSLSRIGNHYRRSFQDGCGNGQSERLCGAEIDAVVEVANSLHRQITRLRAFQDLSDRGRVKTPDLVKVSFMRDQRPCLGIWEIR